MLMTSIANGASEPRVRRRLTCSIVAIMLQSSTEVLLRARLGFRRNVVIREHASSARRSHAVTVCHAEFYEIRTIAYKSLRGTQLPDPVEHVGGVDAAVQILHPPHVHRFGLVSQSDGQLTSHEAQVTPVEISCRVERLLARIAGAEVAANVERANAPVVISRIQHPVCFIDRKIVGASTSNSVVRDLLWGCKIAHVDDVNVARRLRSDDAEPLLADEREVL